MWQFMFMMYVQKFFGQPSPPVTTTTSVHGHSSKHTKERTHLDTTVPHCTYYFAPTKKQTAVVLSIVVRKKRTRMKTTGISTMLYAQYSYSNGEFNLTAVIGFYSKPQFSKPRYVQRYCSTAPVIIFPRVLHDIGP